MTTLNLTDIQGGFQSAAAVNENYRKIEVAVNDSLSRTGEGYNVMQSDLDMGGNNIYNWGNPIKVEGFNWTGPWESGKLYKVGDVAETGSISYITIVEHTSTTSLAADISNWQLVAGASYPNVVSLRWKGDWAPDTFYIIGDVVKNADSNWVALEEHTSGAVFTGLEWDSLASGDPLPDHDPADGDVLITDGALVKWGRVTAGNITTGSLSAITTNTGTLEVAAGGWIKGGQSDYNTGTGWWQGYHMGTYKMSIAGASGNKFTYDGTNVSFEGTISAGSININNRFTVSTAGAVSITSAASGARLEIKNNVIRMYDAAGVLRIEIGDNTA